MKKIILISVFVLVAGIVFTQEPGEFEVSVWPDGEAIYKLIGQVYPDEFNVEAETMIKEFTVLSEKDEKFIVDMEGGKYLTIRIEMLDRAFSGEVKIAIRDSVGNVSLAGAKYDFYICHRVK